MTASGHGMSLAVTDSGLRLNSRRMRWTRGATSGALLLIAGAWAAIVPFVGPYVDLAYSPAANTAWNWTPARGWFDVAPGAVAFSGGLLLVVSTSRAVSIAGSGLATAGGAWLIVGPSLAGMLSQSLGSPDPASSTTRQALEQLLFFQGAGGLIVVLAATALGRISVHRVRDVATAGRRAAPAQASAALPPATDGGGQQPAAAAAPAAAGGASQLSTSQSEPTAPQSDYERIGGGRAVSAVVDRFYESVVADPELAPFFAQTDMSRLKRHQVMMISQVMGGPVDYDGPSLRDAHRGLDISSEHFGRVVTHLVAALQDASVPEDVIGRLGAQLGQAQKDIVQAAG